MKLVFSHRHYGKEIISNHLSLSSEDPKVETLWLKLYKVRVPYSEESRSKESI